MAHYYLISVGAPSELKFYYETEQLVSSAGLPKSSWSITDNIISSKYFSDLKPPGTMRTTS